MKLQHTFAGPLKLSIGTLLIASMVLSGCQGPVPASKFAQFDKSVSSLHMISDDLFDRVVDMAEDGYVDGSLDQDVSYQDLQLVVEPESFKYSISGAPYYELAAELQKALNEYTKLMANYSSLLSQLAGGAATDRERIERLATALNGNMSDASAALNSFISHGADSSPSLSNEATGLITTLTARALEATVEAKRRAALKKILCDGQPVIEEFTSLGSLAVQVASVDIEIVYTRWYEAQATTYESNDDEIRRLEQQRRSGTPLTSDEIWILRELAEVQSQLRRDLIDRNKVVTNTVDSLRNIHASFSKIPAAHEALAKSLESGESPNEALERLFQDVRRLESLYRKLSKN